MLVFVRDNRSRNAAGTAAASTNSKRWLTRLHCRRSATPEKYPHLRLPAINASAKPHLSTVKTRIVRRGFTVSLNLYSVKIGFSGSWPRIATVQRRKARDVAGVSKHT
jgi:hypothetical protein